MGGCCCAKCAKCCGWTLVVIGALFLLQDLGRWDFWGLNWYTVVFLYLGLTKVGSLSCKDCQAMCKPKKK